MKWLRGTIITVLLGVMSAWANEGVLLVHKKSASSSLSKNDVTKIFLGKRTNWSNGGHITIGYATNNKTRSNAFFKALVGKSQKRFRKYWVKRVFSGYGAAPRIFKDGKEALAYVSEHEGSIVFINETLKPNGDVHAIRVSDLH